MLPRLPPNFSSWLIRQFYWVLMGLTFHPTVEGDDLWARVSASSFSGMKYLRTVTRRWHPMPATLAPNSACFGGYMYRLGVEFDTQVNSPRHQNYNKGKFCWYKTDFTPGLFSISDGNASAWWKTEMTQMCLPQQIQSSQSFWWFFSVIPNPPLAGAGQSQSKTRRGASCQSYSFSMQFKPKKQGEGGPFKKVSVGQEKTTSRR